MELVVFSCILDSESLGKAIDTPIVIHGGTGLSDETFRRLISLGAAKINVSTAIKHGYIDGSKEYLKENPDKLDPLSFDRYLNDSIRNAAERHMKVFSSERIMG